MDDVIMYNKYNPVLSLVMENGRIIRKKEVINNTLLPICLQDERCTVDNISEWLSKRRITEDRDGLAEVRRLFGGFETYHNMFSLSDQYWFQYNKKETWDKLNFFRNKYEESVGDFFFFPWSTKKKEKGHIYHTPDLTTNGILKKRWLQQEDMSSVLLKAGSEKYHQEPLSEVLASIIIGQLDIIPYIRYELTVHGLCMCSRCSNFVDENTEFVPASHIYNLRNRALDDTYFDHFIKMCKLFDIQGVREYMLTMIAVDQIVQNNDRHFGNFGFIRNVETGDILGFAPLFDFGRCFYGGNKRMTLTNPLFEERRAQALKHIMKKVNLSKIRNDKIMKKLIWSYPCLTDTQRENIDYKVHGVEYLLEKENLEMLSKKSEKHKKMEEKGENR